MFKQIFALVVAVLLLSSCQDRDQDQEVLMVVNDLETTTETSENEDVVEDLNHLIVLKSSSSKYSIFLPLKDNVYLRLNFKRITRDNFSDVFRINEGFLQKRVGTTSFKDYRNVFLTGIWENAMFTSGAGYTDALGSSHGWENWKSFLGEIDGRNLEELSDGYYKAETLSFTQESDLLTVDGDGVVAQSSRMWKFERNKLYLNQEFRWKDNLKINKNSYTAMCPIIRSYTSGQKTRLISSEAVKNNDYQIYDVSEPGFTHNAYDRTDNTVNKVLIGGSLFSVKMDITNKEPFLEDQHFFVQNLERYNKLYYAHGSQLVSDGDIWNISVAYTFYNDNVSNALSDF